MTPALGTKIVATLTARELRHWRDSLLDKGIPPSTVTRTSKCLAAAFALAAAHDPRIEYRDAWRHGLAALVGANKPRNVVLDDDTVKRIIAAAYEISAAFGVLVELLA